MSSYREPKLKVSENHTYLFNLKTFENIDVSKNTHFIITNSDLNKTNYTNLRGDIAGM